MLVALAAPIAGTAVAYHRGADSGQSIKEGIFVGLLVWTGLLLAFGCLIGIGGNWAR